MWSFLYFFYFFSSFVHNRMSQLSRNFYIVSLDLWDLFTYNLLNDECLADMHSSTHKTTTTTAKRWRKNVEKWFIDAQPNLCTFNNYSIAISITYLLYLIRTIFGIIITIAIIRRVFPLKHIAIRCVCVCCFYELLHFH